MASNWDYQIRITLTDESALKYRQASSAKEFSLLNSLLARHSATLKSQFDAFSEYVSTAEAEGTEKYGLYQWTKDTIEDPEKKLKYLTNHLKDLILLLRSIKKLNYLNLILISSELTLISVIFIII